MPLHQADIPGATQPISSRSTSIRRKNLKLPSKTTDVSIVDTTMIWAVNPDPKTKRTQNQTNPVARRAPATGTRPYPKREVDDAQEQGKGKGVAQFQAAEAKFVEQIKEAAESRRMVVEQWTQEVDEGRWNGTGV